MPLPHSSPTPVSFRLHAAQTASARQAEAAASGPVSRARPPSAHDPRGGRRRARRSGRDRACRRRRRRRRRRGRSDRGARGRRLHADDRRGSPRSRTRSRRRRGRRRTGTRFRRRAARTTRFRPSGARTTSRSTRRSSSTTSSTAASRSSSATRFPRATVAQLESFAQDNPRGTVLAPYPALGNQIALGAWVTEDASKPEEGTAYLAKCTGFDQGAFDAFFDAYQFQGPERFPADSLLPGRT